MVSRKSTINKKDSRTASSFQRRQAIYSNNETILIVCEGETEVNYFNALKREYRLSFLTVKLSEAGSAPISIVKYAIEFAENNEAMDQVFCVFDRDQHSTFVSPQYLRVTSLGQGIYPSLLKMRTFYLRLKAVFKRYLLERNLKYSPIFLRFSQSLSFKFHPLYSI